jgi:YVTN family beta-propeller protein
MNRLAQATFVRALAVLVVCLCGANARSQPFLYVSHQNDGNVGVIDTWAQSMVDVIPVGGSPQDVAILPDGSVLYVASATDYVAVVDTASRTMVASVTVGANPIGLAINADGSMVYVTNTADDTVSFIETAGNTVVDTIGVGGAPVGVEISPDGSTLYVANRDDDTVSVIDAVTRTLIDTVPVGGFPIQMAVHPSGALVYVPNAADDTVSVVYAPTGAVVSSFPVGDYPLVVAVNPADTGVAYVTHARGASVGVIDLATQSLVGNIVVDPDPWGLAFGAAGTTLYTNSFGSDSVSVIDTATGTVTATIPVGDGPVDLIVSPEVPCVVDLNADGRVDSQDFVIFLNLFVAGC